MVIWLVRGVGGGTGGQSSTAVSSVETCLESEHGNKPNSAPLKPVNPVKVGPDAPPCLGPGIAAISRVSINV